MLADINGNLADLRSEAMASQRFCLRWNNHQSNLLSVFDQLLHDESFVDVTLAVEGQLLRAHKMVLSACSPYFQVRIKQPTPFRPQHTQRFLLGRYQLFITDRLIHTIRINNSSIFSFFFFLTSLPFSGDFFFLFYRPFSSATPTSTR